MPKEQVLWHQSGVNRRGEPFVQLMLDDQVIAQMDPMSARSHAANILETIEAAEQDAFMLSFAKETIGVDEHGAAQLLTEFRRWRERHGKKGPPSDPAEFMVTDKHRKP
jgi:hypothetical protein